VRLHGQLNKRGRGVKTPKLKGEKNRSAKRLTRGVHQRGWTHKTCSRHREGKIFLLRGNAIKEAQSTLDWALMSLEPSVTSPGGIGKKASRRRKKKSPRKKQDVPINKNDASRMSRGGLQGGEKEKRAEYRCKRKARCGQREGKGRLEFSFQVQTPAGT